MAAPLLAFGTILICLCVRLEVIIADGDDAQKKKCSDSIKYFANRHDNETFQRYLNS